jgi:hypothetical protein
LQRSIRRKVVIFHIAAFTVEEFGMNLQKIYPLS